jgi:hypothetical protein
MSDTRVAYGAFCFWWGDIQQVGLTPPHTMTVNGEPHVMQLPCCPTCGGLLMEAPTEAAFLEGAQKYESEGHPGYVDFVRWSKGKCFKTRELAEAAYAARSTEGEPRR